MIKTHASLFSGIGAAEIAADWMGWQNAFHCEIQPSWFVGENVVGLLSMVQPGEDVKVGRTDDLFQEDYIYRKEQRFTLDEICEGLERAGYAVQPFVVPACAVGAPHRRDRVWIVAHRNDAGLEEVGRERQDGVLSTGAAAYAERCGGQEIHDEIQPRQPNGQGTYGNGLEQLAAYADEYGHPPRQACERTESGGQDKVPLTGKRTIGSQRSDGLPRLQRTACDTDGTRLERGARTGLQGREYGFADASLPADRWRDFPTQSPVCSRDDELSARLAGITFPRWRAESIKALGNAMVPAVVYEIFRAIAQVENEKNDETHNTATG